MEINNKTILVLGGTGLVGTEVIKKLKTHSPKSIILLSLGTDRDIKNLHELKKNSPKQKIIFVKGNIFNDTDLDLNAEKLNNEIFEKTLLYETIIKYEPEIIIDCINSATSLAYKEKNSQIILSKLIRHVNILYQATRKDNSKRKFKQGSKIYIKVGTTGTGGMGFNIPYTHGENKPSESLLTKAALGWAHMGLLFTMSRTPDAPIIKEIKPATAIAWGDINYGIIKPNGESISLVEDDREINLKNAPNTPKRLEKQPQKPLKSVYISTGENGYFSLQEFITITAPGQMEFITAEEVARKVIQEIFGYHTGKNVIAALNASVTDSSYNSGILREQVILEMKKLIEENECDSIAFEILGPPRLSKLLFETNLIKRMFGYNDFINLTNTIDVSKGLENFVRSNSKIKSEIISIGIPILMPDGKTLIAGNSIKVPHSLPKNVTDNDINNWAKEGWVDLRPININKWQKRLAEIKKFIDMRNIEEGEIVAWIFENEDQGSRVK